MLTKELNASDFSWKRFTNKDRQNLRRLYKILHSQAKNHDREDFPGYLLPQYVKVQLGRIPGLIDFIQTNNLRFNPPPDSRGYIRWVAELYLTESPGTC